MDKKLVVILMGPPGAGKGTQGELLAERLNLYYFETSRIIEESFNGVKKNEFIKIGKEKYYFYKEKELWQKGILCSPPFVAYLVEKKIKSLFKEGKNILFSGSPRTVFEAEQIMPLIEKLYGRKNIKVILMEISAKESIFRNSHRRICELMRHPILYSKETKNLKICPIDGSKLLKREGLDDPETIKVRLKEYKNRTLPLIKYLASRKLKIKKVNGQGTVAQVFRRNLAALK